jgi:hypothetical protein
MTSSLSPAHSYDCDYTRGAAAPGCEGCPRHPLLYLCVCSCRVLFKDLHVNSAM